MKIISLYEKEESKEGLLTSELEQLYGGNLAFPECQGRPYVIGNFVETIDGVVSFGVPGRSGGGPISGFSDDDRFVMGLLRSVSDAVLIGSGTLHGDTGHVRIPELIYPDAKNLYAALRRKLGKSPLPLNIVLTASGGVDLNEPTFQTAGLQAVIITTEEGALRLASNQADMSHIAIRSTRERGATTPGAVLKILENEFRIRLLLHEGGPTIFGQFLAARMIDELFLTLAPQIGGRQSKDQRPSIAGESVFFPETAPWFSLVSAKRGSDHLLLRYTSLQA